MITNLTLPPGSRIKLLLFVCVLLVLNVSGISVSRATMSQYRLTVSSGSPMDVSNGTTVYSGNGYGYRQLSNAGNYSIGFTFNFDGTNYTTFRVATTGILGLGSTITSNWSGNGINA